MKKWERRGGRGRPPGGGATETVAGRRTGKTLHGQSSAGAAHFLGGASGLEGGGRSPKSPKASRGGKESALRYSTAPHRWESAASAAALLRYYGYGKWCVLRLWAVELPVCPLTCLGQSGDVLCARPSFPVLVVADALRFRSLAHFLPLASFFLFFPLFCFGLFCSHPKRKKLRGASFPAEQPLCTQQFHDTIRAAPDRNTTHGAQLKKNRAEQKNTTQKPKPGIDVAHVPARPDQTCRNGASPNSE